MTTATQFLRRLQLHHLRPSLPLYDYLYLTSPFASSSSLYRLLSTATSPNPHFSVVDYLIQSCGLSSENAIQASEKIKHLKSPDKPDAVLRFLRHIGVSEFDIRTAVTQDPCILTSSVENSFRPNVTKLQEIGLPNEDIYGIISQNPQLFKSNVAPKIDFWMCVLGSSEYMPAVLRKARTILITSSLQKVLVPNISFLQEQCGLSVRHVVRLIKMSPRLIVSRPTALESIMKRAEELGVVRSSGMFINALSVVSKLNISALNARIHNLKSLGLAQEEVNLMIAKFPLILGLTEENVRSKMDFLMKEAGCSMIDVVNNPALLTVSLEKRLIPRSIVRKRLMSKGIPVENKAFSSFMKANEKEFVRKFVLPYEHTIPGLSKAYADACAGNIEAVE